MPTWTGGTGLTSALTAMSHELTALRTSARKAQEILDSERARFGRDRAMLVERLSRLETVVAARQAVEARDEPARVPPDLGANLRPDPRSARTSAELMNELRAFRLWSGNPSYRDMARHSGQRASSSAMHAALVGDVLPARLVVIDAVVEGCGGSDEDRARFATAWRRIAMAASGRDGRVLQLRVTGDYRIA